MSDRSEPDFLPMLDIDSERSKRLVPLSISFYLLLLFAIPARFVVPGFGAAGAPASLVGAMMLGLLVAGFFHINPVGPRSTPILWALLAWAAVIVAGYANARLRPVTPLSSTTSDRAMITMASLFGVAFFVMVHVRTVAAVRRLIDVALAFSVVMCLVGLVQFFLGVDLTQRVPFPGLVANSQGIEQIAQRSIFNRPFGTALHPIEFGVVTAAMVPLAVARAAERGRKWLSAMVVLLAFSALLSISRSAVLALAAVFLVMLAGFSWRGRLNLFVGTLVFVVAAGSIVPGLVGTLRSLFTGTSNDPSIQARVARTPEVLRLISEYPWFGRGFGVFTPEDFLLLDNEIQKLAIEIGVIGVAVLIALALTVSWCAVHIGRVRPDLKLLSYGLLATTLGVLMSSYTFDAFFYHILAGVLYVSIGLVSVLWSVRNDPIEGQELAVAQAALGSEIEASAAKELAFASAGSTLVGKSSLDLHLSPESDVSSLCEFEGAGKEMTTDVMVNDETEAQIAVERGGLTMLVANDGGHLAQLYSLSQRLNLGKVVWVTVPTAQSRSLLAGQDVVWTGTAKTRDWKAVIRNQRLIRSELKARRPAVVISTGSSLALSALPQAARMGCSAHYIESVTRTENFSVTGRILQLTRKVKLYTQWKDLQGGRWGYGGSVLDGYSSNEQPGSEEQVITKVVVSLGTQGFGFRRAAERLAEIFPRDVEVLWQTGPTDVSGLKIDARESVPADELEAAMAQADVVIAHAGAGIAITALAAGKQPLLIPRRSEHGEHIDDHQQQIARQLKNRGLAVVAEADSVTWLDVQAASRQTVTQPDQRAAFELDL